MSAAALLAALAALLFVASAQTTCTTSPTLSYPAAVASGYQVGLVATGLARPRGIHFDKAGHLLVVEAPRDGEPEISALSLNDGGGICVREASRKTVVRGQGLNHGITMSSDGTLIYASSMNSAWSWTYDAVAQSASGQRSLVGGMAGSDHVTRTLLLSEKVKDMLIISRGSDSNIDLVAADISSGHSQIRAFNISELTGGQNFTYASDGLRLGWGLRNSVGVAEHPITGGIWSVENSADDLRRNGVSIRQDNPGEELNFHGYLNGTKDDRQGGNFGYPQCYAVWNSKALPQNANLPVGAQFAPDGNGGNDTYCASQLPPRLAFLAHQAPLDIKFNRTGTEAWISFHGSWNRDIPSGYKLSMVPFENGEPVAASDNTTAAIDIFANVDTNACPDHCFRPTGLAFDSQGRLFMSSDATGEIYVISRSPTTSNDSGNQRSLQTGEGEKACAAASSILGLIALVASLALS